MAQEKIRILSLSDQVVDRLYSPYVKNIFSDVDLILSCGDLPYYYLEYILDMLNKPMYFVHGNHDPEVEIGAQRDRKQPWGAENIHCKVVVHKGITILGFEGAIRYSKEKHQYTQLEVWLHVLRMVPKLIWMKIKTGRFLDILVTHSPAEGLGDDIDPAHTGFRAYRWLLQVFKPRYHLHGHIHIYDRNDRKPINFQDTIIINVSSYYKLNFLMGENHE